MKHLSTVLLFAFGFLFLHATYANTLKESDIQSIFAQINTDKDTTLEGDEIEKALVEATTKLFEKSKFYKDEGLIKEVAKQYAKECKSELTQEDFKGVVNKLFSFAKNFREGAYRDILKKFEMNEVLNDPDLLEEVMRAPDVYGITYNSHKDVFDDIEKIYKETAETIQEIQKKLHDLLEKAEDSESTGHKVTLRQLGEVKEGVHQVQEGAQEVGHKIEEGVHAGVHRVQEGVQEVVNTIKEKIEKGQHKTEETAHRAESATEAAVNTAKSAVQGDNAAEKAANKAGEVVDDVKNTVKEGAHRVEEAAHGVGHTVEEGIQKGVNRVDETIEKGKHRIEETGTAAGHRAEETKDRAQEAAQRAAETVKEKAQDAVDAARDGLHLHREKTLTEKLAEAAGTIGDHVTATLHKVGEALGLHKKDEGVKDKVQDAVQNAKGKIQEGVDKVKEKIHGDEEL